MCTIVFQCHCGISSECFSHITCTGATTLSTLTSQNWQVHQDCEHSVHRCVFGRNHHDLTKIAGNNNVALVLNDETHCSAKPQNYLHFVNAQYNSYDEHMWTVLKNNKMIWWIECNVIIKIWSHHTQDGKMLPSLTNYPFPCHRLQYVR